MLFIYIFETSTCLTSNGVLIFSYNFLRYSDVMGGL